MAIKINLGAAGDDVLRGSLGADVIRGLSGDDRINGDRTIALESKRGGLTGADDRIFAGDGDDRIFGDGNVWGDGQAAIVSGQGGDAILIGEDDHLDGGDGDDVLWGDGAASTTDSGRALLMGAATIWPAELETTCFGVTASSPQGARRRPR